MAEYSGYWGGRTVGDAAAAFPYGARYGDDIFSDIFGLLFSSDRQVDAVLRTSHPSYVGQLAVTAAGAGVSVAAGAALVDGKWYLNTAAKALANPLAGDGTYYVVLRKDFASQTVRAVAVAAIVRTDGVTWDVSIATVVVSGGAATVTDTRYFLHYAGKVNHAMLEDGIIEGHNIATGVAWQLIAESVLVADGGLIDFNSIPQTYRHLMLVVSAQATANGGGSTFANCLLTFNGDTTNANYFSHELHNHSGMDTFHELNYYSGEKQGIYSVAVPAGDMANCFGSGRIFISGYAQSDRYKLVRTDGEIFVDVATFPMTYLQQGRWSSPNAITRIQVATDSNDGSGNYGFKIGSIFSLYGMP